MPNAGFCSPDPDPFDQVAGAEVLERLAQEVAELPARDRTILGLYYERGLTMKEIGQALGITESRICQIHTKTVKDLGKKLTEHVVAAPAGRESSRR